MIEDQVYKPNSCGWYLIALSVGWGTAHLCVTPSEGARIRHIHFVSSDSPEVFLVEASGWTPLPTTRDWPAAARKVDYELRIHPEEVLLYMRAWVLRSDKLVSGPPFTVSLREGLPSSR